MIHNFAYIVTYLSRIYCSNLPHREYYKLLLELPVNFREIVDVDCENH
jgi:hypothetical protein